ncbi:mannose-6-phosphate isomerase-like protein (cupin superfamily)/Arc/MetJ-type ribon-helix-helix transcriptional regulator [Kibdelosporangium banguiense]|uniref:Mannose-6-phosphate isomerase-like protein (Cupin superfamily)/Arc/MetJ-type ribon-helix-helix transcriptional regulator n=1 Tax=Kibdelosporangium banguiense TaxID=1365924 RepID=A0ABS4U3G0_9PSEU|nr:cupin domain-containing protein [Kibdelosporangium banguiense]MBP2330695.1 mannose-6-phosphate isomerase-like protein (cupin superfamily)/Arc/MetJ-type ribon-helix-helix transcriptional regulator [Kibdelosporangium banguiense]
MVMPFPGATGISGLRVYDWPTSDGVCGGSPHVHLTCSECYVVINGSGRVQTLTRRGFAEVPLRPATVAWFTPGTIHRLVNDADLQIVVIMQNSGLPEAGDAVFTFPSTTLADPDEYTKAASLPRDEAAAQQRRDLAIEGFLELRRHIESGDYAPLDEFYQAAVRLKRDRLADWEQRWRSGALAAAQRTGEQLDRLRANDISHLLEADIRVLPPQDTQKFGMCGRLDTHDPDSGVSPHD